MTKKTAALLLTICLPVSAASAQEVVYVIPAANSLPVSRLQAPEQGRRLSSPSYGATRRETSQAQRRGLWQRRERSGLFANAPASAAAPSQGGEADDEVYADRSAVRGGALRLTAPANNAARERQVVYAHRVREGGLKDPYGRLQPDGRAARPVSGAAASGAAANVGNSANGGNSAVAGLNPPRLNDAPRPAPGTSQPASSAETYSALDSSIGASGTGQSLFVDGALSTVRERSHSEWDSLGIRAGAFILRPSAGMQTEFTDNAALSSSNRKSDVAGILRAGFNADSDWSRHALSASVTAEIGRYTRETNQNYVDLNASVMGRIDVRETTSLNTEFSFGLSREGRSAISSGASSARRPLISTYHASALGSHRFNRLSLSLRGGFDYADYGKSFLAGGGGSSNDDRDYSDLTTSARATYHLKPGLSVYSEGGISLRRHTRRVDASGLRRSSDGLSAHAGVRFEVGRLVRADVALGVVHRNYEDSSLKSVTAFSANAQLAWNVTQLTTVYAEVSTDVSETDLAGSSASVERRAVFGIQHELMRNVVLGAEVTGEHNTAIGGTTRQTAFGADLSAEYRINRNSTLTANAGRSQVRSNQAGGDYVEHTMRLGLNLKL